MFCFLIYFLIEGLLLYRILLFSVKPQHESAIGMHVSPPSGTSLPSPSPSHPSRLIRSPCLSSLRHTENSIGYLFYIWYCKFNTLSRFVIAFLPRSKHLLISWLQSPSAVIFGAQENSLIVSIVSPSVCHEVIGLDAMIFAFEC